MPIKVKKYINRKLYDEGASVYISMLELSHLAAKDSDVRVTCDRTGRDITLETLSRALYERLKAYSDEELFVQTGKAKASPFAVGELTKLIAQVPAKKPSKS